MVKFFSAFHEPKTL